MLDDEFRPPKMGNKGSALRIVHRVGHIAHEDDVFAVLGHLPQSEGAAEDAHVGVDAEQNNVVDAALFQQAPDFDAGIADGIAILNFQAGVLGFPGGLRVEALGF